MTARVTNSSYSNSTNLSIFVTIKQKYYFYFELASFFSYLCICIKKPRAVSGLVFSYGDKALSLCDSFLFESRWVVNDFSHLDHLVLCWIPHFTVSIWLTRYFFTHFRPVTGVISVTYTCCVHNL